MDKENVLYMCTHTMKYYSAMKGKGILPFGTTWMKRESSMLSIIRKTEKGIMYNITSMWNLKKPNT